MRRLLLWMAANGWLRRNVPRLWFARRAVRRFMPGERAADALRAAEGFRKQGIAVLFTRLGENVKEATDADRTVQAYLGLLDEIDRRRLEGEISVKLTQLGLDLDEQRATAHLRRLAERAATTGRTLWIDMEGSAYTEQTLTIYEQIKSELPNLGLCLQAYLRRTYLDIERLLSIEPRIRLVKGAYAEPPEIAYQGRRDVDANYLALCVSMLAHLRAGHKLFVGLGTHDVRLIEQVAAHADSIGLARDTFDIEMLYGIRADQQRKLHQRGFRVRVLIAYGEAWYAWYMRRLAERPANVVFALRQLLP